jgi:urease accessory protein
MNGPLGLAGQRCIATLFLAAGSHLSRARREQALEAAREAIIGQPLCAMA